MTFPHHRRRPGEARHDGDVRAECATSCPDPTQWEAWLARPTAPWLGLVRPAARWVIVAGLQGTPRR